MDKGSQFAGFVSVLYLALLLGTPWIIRESTLLLLPPSASAYAQATSAAASATVQALRETLRERH